MVQRSRPSWIRYARLPGSDFWEVHLASWEACPKRRKTNLTKASHLAHLQVRGSKQKISRETRRLVLLKSKWRRARDLHTVLAAPGMLVSGDETGHLWFCSTGIELAVALVVQSSVTAAEHHAVNAARAMSRLLQAAMSRRRALKQHQGPVVEPMAAIHALMALAREEMTSVRQNASQSEGRKGNAMQSGLPTGSQSGKKSAAIGIRFRTKQRLLIGIETETEATKPEAVSRSGNRSVSVGPEVAAEAVAARWLHPQTGRPVHGQEQFRRRLRKHAELAGMQRRVRSARLVSAANGGVAPLKLEAHPWATVAPVLLERRRGTSRLQGTRPPQPPATQHWRLHSAARQSLEEEAARHHRPWRKMRLKRRKK